MMVSKVLISFDQKLIFFCKILIVYNYLQGTENHGSGNRIRKLIEKSSKSF